MAKFFLVEAVSFLVNVFDRRKTLKSFSPLPSLYLLHSHFGLSIPVDVERVFNSHFIHFGQPFSFNE